MAPAVAPLHLPCSRLPAEPARSGLPAISPLPVSTHWPPHAMPRAARQPPGAVSGLRLALPHRYFHPSCRPASSRFAGHGRTTEVPSPPSSAAAPAVLGKGAAAGSSDVATPALDLPDLASLQLFEEIRKETGSTTIGPFAGLSSLR